MGLRLARRSTLADALNLRDWRIYHALALRLISHAGHCTRKMLCAGSRHKRLCARLNHIDLCLSLFEWAPFRSTKAAIKLHTLLDLRAQFRFIHISDGKLHDVNVLDILVMEADASTSWIVATWTISGCTRCISRSLLRHRARWHGCARVYSHPADRGSGVICDQRVMLNGYYSARNTRASAPYSLQRPRQRQDIVF